MMRKCSIKGCEKDHWGRGWCRMHHARWYKYGDPNFRKRIMGENRNKHPLYRTYRSMRQRCYNPKSHQYEYYGGRGIKICARWMGIHGFSNFVEDMGERPEGLELDRINNNRGYSPKNCRWTTHSVQTINRRSLRNTSGVIGVSWSSRPRKWSAEINVYGVNIKLGLFIRKSQAIQARKEAEIILHKPLLEAK